MCLVLCFAVQIQDWYSTVVVAPTAPLLNNPYTLSHNVLCFILQLVVFRGARDGLFVCSSTKQILGWIF